MIMAKFVLIVVFYSYDARSGFTAPFYTAEACEHARQSVLRRFGPSNIDYAQCHFSGH